MTLRWIHESTAVWNEPKAALIGRAAPGIFDRRFNSLADGELLPGEWWHVEDGDDIVGYGWLDVVWGDAEILLATKQSERGRGVGSFILERLADEARERGLNYLYNVIRPTHPERATVSAWLARRGFVASEDGSLLRAVVKHR